MKNYLLLRIISLIILCCAVSFTNLHSQENHPIFNNIAKNDSLYKRLTLARTFKIDPNNKVKFIQVFFGERGYKFNLCQNDSLGQFHIKIIDQSTNHTIWDNSNENYSNEILLSIGSTRRLIIEVTPLNPEKFNGIPQTIGILIKHFYFSDL